MCCTGQESHRERMQAEVQRPEQTCCIWRKASTSCRVQGWSAGGMAEVVPDAAEQAGRDLRVWGPVITPLGFITKMIEGH